MKSFFNTYIIVLLILINTLTSYSENTNISDSKEKNKSELLSNEFLIDSIYVHQNDNFLEKHYIKYHSNLGIDSRLFEYWQDDELQRRVFMTYDLNGNNTSALSEKYENGKLNFSERSIRTFNSNNKITSIINEEKQGNREWEIDFKGIFTYNSEGKKLRTYTEKWLTNRLQNTEEYLYTYDEFSNEIFNSYELISIWEARQLEYETYEYSYNANGQRLTSEKNVWWYESLVQISKETNNYNDDYLLTEKLSENWEIGGAEEIRKKTIQYNKSNKVIQENTERFINEEWILISESKSDYDERNNLIKTIAMSWEDNKLIRHYIFEGKYDDNNNEVYFFTQITERDSLVFGNIIRRSYDENNNLITEEAELAVENNWVLVHKSEFTYYENGKMKTFFSEYWDQNNPLLYSTQFKTFDENGNEITYLIEEYENDIQTNVRKGSRIFDENSNLLSSIDYKWLDEKWVKIYNRKYSYNDNNDILTSLAELFDENYNSNGFLKQQYEYNSNYDILSKIGEHFDINDDLIFSNRYTYRYTEDYKPLSYLYEEVFDGKWVGLNRYFYIYDNDGLLTKYYREYWLYNEWHNDRGKIPVTFPDIISNARGYRMDIFWNNQTINVFEQDDILLSPVFPNPASNSITFKYDNTNISNLNIRIIDKLCKEYLSDYIVNNDEISINIDELPNGVYFILINHENKVELRKFIKIKN